MSDNANFDVALWFITVDLTRRTLQINSMFRLLEHAHRETI